jgi:uncharacterized membrane protein
MKSSLLLFILLLAGAVVFLQSMTAAMPERIASHFDAAGNANGFMDKNSFFAFMLVLRWEPRFSSSS